MTTCDWWGCGKIGILLHLLEMQIRGEFGNMWQNYIYVYSFIQKSYLTPAKILLRLTPKGIYYNNICNNKRLKTIQMCINKGIEWQHHANPSKCNIIQHTNE